MRIALTILSVLAFLAWSLLVIFGLTGLFYSNLNVFRILAFCLYLAGLSVSVWIGFFSAGKLSVGTAFIGQGVLLIFGMFIVSGGLLLLGFFLFG